MTTSASVHEHPEEWLATALADGLSAAERGALTEHLAGCERCRALEADFAALDETLRREFPAAVGPAGGFEARLVAGFRRRHGRGGQLAGLRALTGWLLRQRGVQFAAAAAALLALAEIGQQLTRSPAREAAAVVSDSRIVDGPRDSEYRTSRADAYLYQDSVAVDNKKSTPASADYQTARGSVVVVQAGEGHAMSSSNEKRLPTGPPATLSFGLGDRSESYPNQAPLTVSGTGTVSGSTTTNGTVDLLQRGPGTDPRDRRVESSKDFDGFITYGSPIQTVSQDALGLAPAPAEAPAPAAAKPGAAGPAADVPAATPAPPDARKLIRNARAELEVASFDAAVDAVTAAAARDGGFLDTRDSARGGNGKVSGTLVVKVLPENLDRFLAGLRTLGDVKNQTVQTEDVTKDYFDTDARLRNARRMEDRLLKMLDEVKGKMSEVLQVEKELGRVRAEVETMQGQLKLYDAQVRYATVTLSVREKNLDQPAAFLLHETATLALLVGNVERTAAEARRIADAARAQVLRSQLSRDSSGQGRAMLSLLVSTDAAADVIAQIKALGRVENFHLQDERTAQNGASAGAAGADGARVERAPVTFDITISHDEQISRQVSLTLVAPDADGAFEKARAAALAAGGEIVNANVAHPPNGHPSATLAVRVPAPAEAGFLAALKGLGRVGEVETQRMAVGTDAGGGPVLFQLSVVDVEPAVQDTTVQVQTNEVEQRAADIKREAANAHADVEGSSFSSESDGRQHAALKFRLAMSGYPDFIARVRALGAVKGFTVRREERPGKTPDRAEGDGSAPATVELSLYSEGPVVSANAGVGATVRRTFGQGIGALAWSFQMIGVGLAFVMPWAILLTVIVAGARWWRRRRAARAERGKEA